MENAESNVSRSFLREQKGSCNDLKCATHGSLKVRGNLFTGMVVSAKPSKTVVIQRELIHYLQKYERYKKVMSKIYAYNPLCINAHEGDTVKVGECRRLSKLKSFVVLGIEKKAGAKELAVKVDEQMLLAKEKKPKPEGAEAK